MLKVQDFKTRARRSTESAVERLWADTWKQMGMYSRHMSDAVPGLPDRYVAGARWVEFKSLYRERGAFTFGEGLSEEQWRTCEDLVKAGDRVFYCAQIDGETTGKRYVFLPFLNVIAQRGQHIGGVKLWDVSPASRREITERYLG